MHSIHLLALAILLVSVCEGFSLFSMKSYFNPSNNEYTPSDLDINNEGGRLLGHQTFYDFKAFNNDVFNKTLCYFHQDLRYLICYGFGELARCEITSDFANNLLSDINVYGIELIESTESSSSLSPVKLALYPRSFNEKTWLRSAIDVNGTSLDISISYVNSSFFDMGIQVQDLDCFQSIVNMTRISKKTQMEITDWSRPSASFCGGLFVTRDEESKLILDRYSISNSININSIFNYFYNIFQSIY